MEDVAGLDEEIDVNNKLTPIHLEEPAAVEAPPPISVAIPLLSKLAAFLTSPIVAPPPKEDTPSTVSSLTPMPSPQVSSTTLDLLANIALNYLPASFTDEAKLTRLNNFLDHPLCPPNSRQLVNGWTIRHESDLPGASWSYLLPNQETVPCAFLSVSIYLKLSDSAQKLAELVDYMECTRKLPLDIAEWTCTALFYIYQPEEKKKVRKFTKLALAGDFIEKDAMIRFHRDRAIKTYVVADKRFGLVTSSEEEEGESDSDGPLRPRPVTSRTTLNSAAAAAASTASNAQRTLSMKQLRKLDFGDPVAVDVGEGKLKAGLIVPRPKGDSGVGDGDFPTFSVYYVWNQYTEHRVEGKRIIRTRKETRKDADALGRLRLQWEAKNNDATTRKASSQTSGGGRNKLKSSRTGSTSQQQQQQVGDDENGDGSKGGAFLSQVKKEIGSTMPSSCRKLEEFVKLARNGDKEVLTKLRDFVMELLEDDFPDLCLRLNPLLPRSLHITPLVLRKRQRLVT